jgi:hypothetical protein
MMARVGRLAGAILAESRGEYFLIGQTKVPCDWVQAGFEHPGPLEPTRRAFVRLVRLASARAIDLGSPCLTFNREGEDLARGLAAKLLVERNGSVSDRLWRLVVQGGVDPDHDCAQTIGSEGEPTKTEIDASWLGEIPSAVWQIVRDTVLRCV